nr:hypothetical protein [Tanacetum cinerariifolium]
GKDTAFWLPHFVSCDLVLGFGLAFCFKTCCVFPKRQVAFCFKARCDLLQSSLHFASKLDTLRFAPRHLAFCFKTLAFCVQTSCDLSQDSCDLSHVGTAFCLLLKTLSAITSKDNEDLSWNTSFKNKSLVPQRQKASDYDNPDPVPQRQDVSFSADTDVPLQQELDLLFGPLYDEFSM